MRISLTEAPPTSVARHRAGLLALFVLIGWVTLGAWSLVPRVLGWSSFVVPDGSMEPTLSRGDVVVGTKPPEAALAKDAVILVVTDDDELVVRRVVAITPDGDYAVRVDATNRVDTAPIPAGDVTAVGRVLVPFVGLPAVWFGTGNWLAALGWLFTMAVALVGVPFALRPLPDGEGWVPPWRRETVSGVNLPG
jgi:signal peptidase